MWHDNETTDDFIDFGYLKSTASQIIDNQSLLPCTIGVFGDWGSGKSSLMGMIAKDLEADEETLIIKFNGWLFEGYEDAKTVLMGTILETIEDKATIGEKSKKLVKALLKKVNWMKLTGTAIKYGVSALTLGSAGLAIASGVDLLKDAKEVKPEDYIKEENAEEKSLRMGIRDFHSDFEELLKSTKYKKLVVFIDDLDRCNPDTVIATLEAIKLFLFVKNTAFIISADERLIKYAVRRRFPEIPGEGSEVARDYLEKLIQFPIRVPALSFSEIETFINLLYCHLYLDPSDFSKVKEDIFKQRLNNFESGSYGYEEVNKILSSMSIELEAALHLSRQVSPILTTGLSGNPRQCKRFLNSLMMRIGMAKSRNIELKERVLAKLMLLEYFKGETFKQLSQEQAKENGKPEIIKSLEDKVAQPIEGNKSLPVAVDSGRDAEFMVWLSDAWLFTWLKSEPSLSEEDLRPYFYFSKDKLNSLNLVHQRITPIAQGVLEKLLNQSVGVMKVGLKEFKNLNNSDAAGIFEIISEKAKREANIDLLKMLITLSKEPSELTSQLLTLLNGISPSAIKPVLIAQLKDLREIAEYKEAINKLFQHWADNGDTALSKVAKSTLAK